MKKTKKGFTLVELLVVIAIIAILAAIIAPNAFKAIEKSKVATAEADYKAIKTAALGYYTDTGEWPQSGATTAFVTDPGSSVAPNWNGPYLEKWKTKNPWGGDYSYEIIGATSPANTGLETGNKVIKLDKAPAIAIARLEADLDGNEASDATRITGTVRYASTTATTVYIIISEQ